MHVCVCVAVYSKLTSYSSLFGTVLDEAALDERHMSYTIA